MFIGNLWDNQPLNLPDTSGFPHKGEVEALEARAGSPASLPRTSASMTWTRSRRRCISPPRASSYVHLNPPSTMAARPRLPSL